MRITAQLIDARNGFHLWSETYDRDLKDIFAVQDEISKAIVDALRIELAGGENALLTKQETADPEAHTLLLRGIAAQRQGTPESYAEAERLFRQAIRRDPGYARAHALLANTVMLRAYRRDVPLEAGYVQARAAAERALALDPDAAAMVSNLALSYSDLDRHADAIRTAERARSLDAEEHFTLATLGYVYGRAGKRAEAERALAALRAKSEVSPYLVATVYAGLGEADRAFEMLDGAVEARDDLVPDLGVDPVFNDLRGDPRMQRLLRRIGLG